MIVMKKEILQLVLFISGWILITFKRLNPGHSAVVNCYPVFDDKIIDKATSSKEKAEIKLVSGSIVKNEEFYFEMKGRNDYV